MACDSFFNCVNDPTEGLEGHDNFSSLSHAAVYSINLTLYILYAMLIVSIVYFLFKGVYAIIGADSADSFEKFRGAITNAVFAAVGIVLLVSARFLFVQVLTLIGVSPSDNIFDEGAFRLLLTH